MTANAAEKPVSKLKDHKTALAAAAGAPEWCLAGWRSTLPDFE